MANEVVKYKNDLNLVPMRKFTPVELDLFFSICAKMKNKKTETVRFSFEELKLLSNYKPTGVKRFSEDLEHTYDKMLTLTYGENKEGIISRFVLFTGFEINTNEQYVDITVNSKLEYVLNQLENQFTRFELEEFVTIRSSYAKTMYRLLKQYKSTGFYKVTLENFRVLLDIPDSYNMSRIDQRVLEPIEKELTQLYQYLHIKKIKNRGRGRGGTVTHLEFNFSEKKEIIVPMFDWTEESIHSTPKLLMNNNPK